MMSFELLNHGPFTVYRVSLICAVLVCENNFAIKMSNAVIGQLANQGS